jgi:SAM-dependent methyltransferase
MPDAIFADRRLVPLYDLFDGDRGDLAAYHSIVDELGASLVLDVGCGTGSLAIVLARHGHRVIGVDPAEASLDVARAKDGARRVRWIHGDAMAIPALDADLATMTGNVAQVFLTDDDWARTLQNIRDGLRPNGHLVFETRRPEYRAWAEWAMENGPVTRDIPGIGPVERRFEVIDVSLPTVSFRFTYRFPLDGTEVTSESTLRFRGQDEVKSTLNANGYLVLDVRQAPDRPGQEFVFVTKRST